MALSTLKIGSGNTYGIYNSNTKEWILKGTEKEMDDWLEAIHRSEQEVSNRQYMNELKKERVLMLVNAGYSQEEATVFLKSQMPNLYE